MFVVCQPDLDKKIAKKIAKNKRCLTEGLSEISAPASFMVYPNLQEMLEAVRISVDVRENWVYLASGTPLSFPEMPESTKERVAEVVGRLIADALTQQIGEGKWQFTFCHDSSNEYVIYVSPADN